MEDGHIWQREGVVRDPELLVSGTTCYKSNAGILSVHFLECNKGCQSCSSSTSTRMIRTAGEIDAAWRINLPRQTASRSCASIFQQLSS